MPHLGCRADWGHAHCPLLAPVANAQTVSVPNTLTNGSLAEADAMNANFEAVRTGVNLALTSADVTGLTQFTNGATADADQANANFTAVVDGVNTALANRATDCAGAGGTWNAGTSICTAASSYNCFIGGFCAQAAIDFPPATFGYVNVYDGATQSTEPALGAGCNTSSGSAFWTGGREYVDHTCCGPPPVMCQLLDAPVPFRFRGRFPSDSSRKGHCAGRTRRAAHPRHIYPGGCFPAR